MIFLLNALETRERNLVCFGGSESKIESACSQLKVDHSDSGSFDLKIRPRDLLRSTAFASSYLPAKTSELLRARLVFLHYVVLLNQDMD